MNRFAKALYWSAFGIVCIWPLLTVRESFWIDELHSLWVIDGPWSQVVERSSLGNQSSLYFFGLKGWLTTWNVATSVLGLNHQAVGRVEFGYRSLSWLAWCFFVGMIAWRCRHWPAVGYVIAAWLFFDRIGHFYAIETRPYAFVILTSWLLISEVVHTNVAQPGFNWRWLGLALAAFYLHYTAGLLVLWSWMGLLLRTGLTSCNRPYRLNLYHLYPRVLEGIAFLAAAMPGLIQLLAISHKSNQWQQFAGDSSLYSLMEIMPWAMWWVVPGIALLLERLFWREVSQPSYLSVRLSSSSFYVPLVIGTGTLISTWWLTYVGIAPLMHHRYVVGVYAVLVSLSIPMLAQFRTNAFLFLAGLLSISSLILWQGTWQEWQSGRFLPWQRKEDWRGVGNYLQEHAQSADAVLIAPMLIETQNLDLPSTIPSPYLTCPLRTAYAPHQDLILIPVANPTSAWLEAARSRQAAQPQGAIWLAVRSSDHTWFAERISSLANEASVPRRTHVEHVFHGGRVQLYRISH